MTNQTRPFNRIISRSFRELQDDVMRETILDITVNSCNSLVFTDFFFKMLDEITVIYFLAH